MRNSQLKKYAWILVSGIVGLISSSCAEKPPEAPPAQRASSGAPTAQITNMSQKRESFVNPSEKIWIEAKIMGKQLLQEYDVQANQTIRFPCQDYVFQTHGADAITSAEEARSKYPHWLVPDKLGDFQFVDFTLHRDRTSLVYPDYVPPPKYDTVEVLTDKEPAQYYLCYENDSGKFQLDVMPVSERTSREEINSFNMLFRPWPEHPSGYFDPMDENNLSPFRSIWIVPELDGDYGFFVHKISGADCLECEEDFVPFTEKEASAIYEGIMREFPMGSPQ